MAVAHDNHMVLVDASMAFGMTTGDATQAFSSTNVHHTSRLCSMSPARQHAICLCLLIADNMYSTHAKVLLDIKVCTSTTQTHTNCSWAEHCHDMHLSSKATKVVNTLSNNVHMQRCWAGWKPARVKILNSNES